ncbi:MAG TPA: class I SAM-dependent methyltransferase [Chitinophagaceae bacterium]|jgi:ubiquinone/menaquinone biosynthesis C-methylase UbiE|nr:class I SAM-dependent methyltransferase [Chitinophagaceae bacterium]
MSKNADMVYGQQAAAAFNEQSSLFDKTYSAKTIVQYKRTRVRDHVERFIKPQSTILELNAGTGEDAVYFAQHGHSVHATDISKGMQEMLSQKILSASLTSKVSYELCSFTQLETLKNKGPYDFIFSNFAGLNCTNELDKVLQSFSTLLNPGGIITLVLLPKFCLWETSLLFKGKFRTAFRRFFSSRGRKAHIEGQYFRCWYYNPSFIKRSLKNEFDVLALDGLCTLVPPSYIENFAEKFPKTFKALKDKEEKWKSKWPWRSVGDYYIISLIKKP